MSIYEKVVFPKGINSSVFWILFGTLFLLLSEIIPRFFGETWPFWPRFILVYEAITILPIAIIIFSYSLKNSLEKVGSIFEIYSDSNKKWIENNVEEFSTFRSISSKIFVLILSIFFIIGALTSGLYFDTFWLTLIIYIAMPIGLIIGSHGAHSILVLLKILYQLSNKPIKQGIHSLSSPDINSLFNVYSRVSLLAIILYSGQVLAFVQSNLDFSPQIILWMTITSFFPLVIFVASIFQVRKLIINIKFHNMKLIDDQIQKISKNIKIKTTEENTLQLLNLLEIRNKIEKSNEWPFAFEGIATLILTIVIPLAQIIISALGIIK